MRSEMHQLQQKGATPLLYFSFKNTPEQFWLNATRQKPERA